MIGSKLAPIPKKVVPQGEKGLDTLPPILRLGVYLKFWLVSILT